jgi:hypothetical protein
MALVLRPIEQLRWDNSFIWILDWFGGLVDNPRGFDNQSIECVFTPCVPTSERANGLLRRVGSQVCATVGVKAIGTLGLGRQYIDGNFVPFSAGFTEETISFRFDPRIPGSVQENLLDRIGLSPPSALINQPLDRAGIKSPIKVVNGQLLRTDHPWSRDRSATPSDPAPIQVMFHELEIIRFYYTNSVKLVGAVFNGHFAEDKLGRDVLNMNHQGPHYDFDRGHHRFEYRLGFAHDDACLIARALFDPTQTAMRGVRRVHQSLLTSKLNELNPRKTGYPRTLFPYLEEAELTLTGRRLKLEDGRFIFAVHRIESCSAHFPFYKLSYQCEIQPGGPEAPEGAAEAFAGQPFQTGPGKNRGVMDSEGRPAAGSDIVESLPDIRRFTSLDLSQCKVEKYRPNTHRSSENRWTKNNLKLDKSSPGTPTHGESDSVRQSIVDVLEGGEVPVDLGVFVQIIQGLQVRHTNWHIQTVTTGPAAWRHPETNIYYNGFPTVPCPELTSMWRQFSFLDKEKTQRRRLICAQVQTYGRTAYLLEAERRLNEQSEYMEELPILMVWRGDLDKVSRGTLEALLTMTVKNPSKTWPKDISSLSLERKKIEHGKARNVRDLVERISRSLQDVVG